MKHKVEKRRLEHSVLESYVTDWIVRQLEDIQEETYLEQDFTKKEFKLYTTMQANKAKDLLSFLEPMRHDEDSLVEWAIAYSDMHSKVI